MAFFGRSEIPIEEVKKLKAQGLSDNQVIDELRGKDYSLMQINDALAQAAMDGPENIESPMGTGIPTPPEIFSDSQSTAPAVAFSEELHGRVEEIAESIIDEKWDLLIEEVKKIIDWKDNVENDIDQIKSDVGKIKEDFKELHQGVLGKLESYDAKMTEVGTELSAVGKVFKEVVPEFVENVKELKSVTKSIKGKK